MKKPPVLSAEEQISLCQKWQQEGDRAAYERLTECSIPLVRHIAYQFKDSADGYEMDDLIQEGCFALLDAIRWFKAELGFQFTTYAGDCIRRRLKKYLEQQNAKPLQQEPIPTVPGENPLDGIPANEPHPVFIERAEEIREAIRFLPITQQRIIAMRLGTDGAVHNWTDIAQQVGLSPRQVSEAFGNAIGSLKRSPRLEPSLN